SVRGEGYLRNEFTQADRVRWIDNYRQMCFRLQERNGAEIERVACRCLERADTALAQDHVHIAFAQNVRSAHNQIVDRGAESALEQDRQIAAAHLFQE